MRSSAILAAMLVLTATLSGCGVAFSDPPHDHALFQSLEITGTRTAGSPLTAALGYQQNLPITIPVRCELRQNKQLIKTVGEDTVPQYPGGSPKQTPFPGQFSYDFSVEKPGDYKLECFTTSDEDNTIINAFTVHASG